MKFYIGSNDVGKCYIYFYSETGKKYFYNINRKKNDIIDWYVDLNEIDCLTWSLELCFNIVHKLKGNLNENRNIL